MKGYLTCTSVNVGRVSSLRSVLFAHNTDTAFTVLLHEMSGTLFTLTSHAEALQVFIPLTLVLLEFSEWLCGEKLGYCCPELYLQP